MSEHYYSAQPSSKHDQKTITLALRGIQLRLLTDSGVFAKEHIDPGTRLLIEAVPQNPEYRAIFDLGCGYGPIGLSLARLFPQAVVYMADINERAVALAHDNAVLNGLRNVEIRSGEGFTSVAGQTFDLVVTNPPIRAGKQVVYPLVTEAREFLREGGWLAAVILTRQGAKSLEKKMAEVFGNVTQWEKGGGYRVLASQK